MSPILRATELRRSFGKREPRFAVDGVDLRIDAGQIVTILGPNGAGKTTTIKMCSTLLRPTSGTIAIAGIDAVRDPRRARKHLGLVLGGDRGFYGRASARDNLLFFCDVLGVPTRERRGRVEGALHSVGLTASASRRVQEFSRGMTQRLHIARGILGDPRLLLLDEPTNGLDPEIAQEIRALVIRLAERGTAVLLTTHYLREAEELADRVMVLLDGGVAVEGNVPTIARYAGITHVTTLSSLTAPAVMRRVVAESGAVTHVVESRDGRTHVRLSWQGTPDLTALRREAATLLDEPLEDVATRTATLEESYLALVERDARRS